jgi:fluoride exporter
VDGVNGVGIWFWVALAGAAGAAARFVVDGQILARTNARLPWGTALINLSGAFVLGISAGAVTSHEFSLIVGTGFLGAYTTFST